MGPARTSVVMATYNGEPYIEDQVRSIAAQTTPPCEVVIGDDGSTDRTTDIAKIVLGAEGVTVELEVNNTGVPQGPTRNFANILGRARGDFIVLADQDDVWRPDRIEASLSSMSSEKRALLLVSDAQVIDSAGIVVQGTVFEQRYKKGLSGVHQIEGDLVVRRNDFPGMAMMLNRDLLDYVLPIPESWPHDYWILTIASLLGAAYSDPRAVVAYRQHSSNTVGLSDQTFWARLGRLRSKGIPPQIQAERYTAVLERMSENPGAFGANVITHVEQKVRFERARLSALGESSNAVEAIRRLPRIADYARFASASRASYFREIVTIKETRRS